MPAPEEGTSSESNIFLMIYETTMPTRTSAERERMLLLTSFITTMAQFVDTSEQYALFRWASELHIDGAAKMVCVDCNV